jgi:LacI family transcriptional regulator
VAEKAKVSIATVSRVLNNQPNVAPDTRDRVIEALKDTHFIPNAAAQGLVSKTSQTVGILTFNIKTPHYAATAYAIERELFKKNFNAILCNTGGLTEANIRYIRMLASKDVSGIICIGSVFSNTIFNSSILSDFSNIPFVLSNCRVDAPNASCVLIDEQFGMNLAVSHMIEKGRRNLLYIKDADTYSGIQKKRGFLSALQKHGLRGDESCIFEAERGLDGGRDALIKIIQSRKEFNGLIFGDDLTAIGGTKYLQEHGYVIPDDVAIIGCNNSVMAQCSTPTLTSIDYKLDLIGKLSVTMLEAILNGDTVNHIVTLTPDLIVRDST